MPKRSFANKFRPIGVWDGEKKQLNIMATEDITNTEEEACTPEENKEKVQRDSHISKEKETEILASKDSVSDKGKKSGIVINIEHVKKTFGTNTVLQDVNLKVRKGETLVTLGRSGTGKSVILQCIVGLLRPDEGTIRVFSQNIPDLSNSELLEIRKKIGFLFQSGALYDSMTVRENLIFPMKRLYDYNEAEMESRMKEALSNVGLEKAKDKMPSELSGGMRKRIALARTLVLDPEIILYDEPTTGLDPATSREISELILMTQEKFNVASIIVTHDMECAQMTANRVVVLKDGKYIIDGTFDEAERSDDPFVKTFFEFLPAKK
ncbi:hypothetical protein BH10BAC5_BH10BAC5_08300 [soil metagenome]